MMSGVIYVDSHMPSFIHSLDGPVKCLNRYWGPVKCQELQRCWGCSKVPIMRVFSDLFPASPLLCFGDRDNLHRLYASLGAALTTGLQLAPANGSPGEAGNQRAGEAGRACFSADCPLSLSSPSGGASSDDGISSKPPSPSLVPPGPGSLLFLTSGFPWGGLVDHSTLSKPRYLVPHIQFPLSIHPVFLIGFWLLQALKMTN